MNRKENAPMYESDKVVGQTYNEALKVIDRLDLWHEVVDLVVDCYGCVTKVIH